MFKDMHNWKEWLSVDIEEYFHSLKELHIQNCLKLTENLSQYLGSLNKQVITKCVYILASSLPRVPILRELELIDCDALVSLLEEFIQRSAYLRKVAICNCSLLQFFLAPGFPT